MVYQPRSIRLGQKDTSKTTTSETSGYNLKNIDELKAFAESKGLKIEEDKPGLFSRTLDFISRPLYASAGAAKAVTKRVKTGEWRENPLEEAWKGLKAKEKETYSDVLKEAGVKNKWVRGGVGFALDVVLDPTTYFGGSLIKGAGKVAKGVGTTGLSAARKFNPRSVSSLESAGKNLKDAFGNAFDVHYGLKKVEGETVADIASKYFNKLGIAKEDIINTNFKALNKFDTKVLDEATNIRFQNKKLELLSRQGDKVDYIKPKGAVKEAYDEMGGIAGRIGKATGIPEEQLYKNYIPSISKLKERAIQELKPGIEVGSEGYKKLYKGAIPDEQLLKKPIELWSRRELEVYRNNLARETLNEAVDGYGKTVKSYDLLDDAAKAEYRPVYEKGYKPLTTYPVKTAEGKTIRALGKAKEPIGYLKEADFKALNRTMFPEMKTIDMLAKATGYDAFTRFFKTAVTAYFPAFHVRNYISGNIQNYSVLGAKAFNPKNHTNALGFLKGTERKLSFPKWSGTGKEMNKILKEEFGSASRYISDLTDYIEEIGTKGFKVKSKIQKT